MNQHGWTRKLGLYRSLAIYRMRPWRQRVLNRFYAAQIESGSLSFDIGAHVGHRTDAMVAAGSRCISLEPQPLFADYLERRYAGHRKVKIVRDAVGRTPGTAQLAVSSLHPTVSTLSGGWIKQVENSSGFSKVRWDEKVEVQVTTLDALIARYGKPDFCKIDVEGMEAEILAGLSSPLTRISFEYVPAALDVAMACLDRLDVLGSYVYEISQGETHRFFSPGGFSPQDIRQTLDNLARDGQSGDIYARLL